MGVLTGGFPNRLYFLKGNYGYTDSSVDFMEDSTTTTLGDLILNTEIKELHIAIDLKIMSVLFSFIFRIVST